MGTLLDGVLAGYGIAVPVGAIAVLIIGVGVRCGFGCAFSAGAGAATADLVYASVAVTAGSAVAAVLESWQPAIRSASAAVLAALALWGLWGLRRPLASGGPTPGSAGEVGRTYLRFTALTLINPMTVVYFTSMVLGTGVDRMLGLHSVALFALGAFVASLSWQTLLAAAGAIGRRGLSPLLRSGTVLVGNLLILGMAIRMVA